jgi:inosine-uridine nucleoside N-ribohydrolase
VQGGRTRGDAARSPAVAADGRGGGRALTRIVLDCDPGHDDAIALLLALASPELELAGVTTVAGNQTLEKTTANALRVLEHVGRDDVPVAAGAERPLVREPFVAAHVHGETGLDGPDLPPPAGTPVAAHAVEFLAEHAAGQTLVAVGPLTNVALCLALHPDAAPARIVLMGGAIAEGNITPAAEFNIWADPEAARRVFASGIDLTMVGLDVTHKALMTPAHADRLRSTGRAGKLVAELFDFYHRFHAQTYGLPGSPVHDALALAHAVRPGLLQTKHRYVAIDCESELCRGRTVVDLWRRTGSEPNAHVAVAVDGHAFLDLLLERIASLG